MKKHHILVIVAALAVSLSAHAQEALYTAKAAIEFKPAPGTNAVKVLTDNLPRGEQWVTLEPVKDTTVFEILATGADAKGAATRANQVALGLQALLNDPNGSDPAVKITLKASEADAKVQDKVEGAYTPWMDKAQLDAYMASLDGNVQGGKNYWDRGHWITAVEGRWNEGKPEHRIRYSETPKGKKSVVWYWWLNCNQTEWAGHVERYADDGCTLKHWTSYMRPDGRMIYDGVWHKVVDK